MGARESERWLGVKKAAGAPLIGLPARAAGTDLAGNGEERSLPA